MRVDPLELEVAFDLVDLVDTARGGDLLDRVKALRRKVAMETGLVIPLVRTRDNLDLPGSQYVIWLNGVPAAKGISPAGTMLAIGDNLDGIPGKATREPVFGLAAKWVPVELQRQAEMAGATVVDRSSVITTHLAEVVRQNAADLLGREDVRLLVEMVRRTHPIVVEELTPTLLTLGEVQRVLHALLEEGVSIRDLVRIFEALSVRAKTSTDLDGLVEAARSALGSAISHPYVTPDERLHVFTLEPGLRAAAPGVGPAERRRRSSSPSTPARIDALVARLQRPARGGRAVRPVPRPGLLAPGPRRPRAPDAPGPAPASGDLLRRGLPDSADRVAGSCERCRCDPLRPPRATTRSPRRASSSAPGPGGRRAPRPLRRRARLLRDRALRRRGRPRRRPSRRARARPGPRGRRATPPAADFSSPLASAAPARARAAAPARNGAAAWAAEAAARTTRRRRRPHARPVPHRPPRPRPAAPARRAAPRPAGRRPAGDDERVSELAGLLAARQPPSPGARPTPGPRSRAPASSRAASAGRAPADGARRTTDGRRAGRRRLPPPAHRPRSPPRSRGWSPGTGTCVRPSRRPWTSPRRVRPAPRRGLAGRSGPTPSEQQTHRWRRLRPARRRKRWEIRSSRPPRPSSRSRWRCPPGPPSPRSPTRRSPRREEAIAEVLRAALAQGHSDEALAGILRKVLAGASPQTALAEPELPAPARPRRRWSSRTPCSRTWRRWPSSAEAPSSCERAREADALVDVAGPVAEPVRGRRPVAVVAGRRSPRTSSPVVDACRPRCPSRRTPAPTTRRACSATSSPPREPVASRCGASSRPTVPLWGEPVAAAPSFDDEPIWRPVAVATPTSRRRLGRRRRVWRRRSTLPEPVEAAAEQTAPRSRGRGRGRRRGRDRRRGRGRRGRGRGARERGRGRPRSRSSRRCWPAPRATPPR